MTVFPTNDTWYEHYVSYGETDTMGVLYYGEYFHIFERARSQFIRERGMSYAEVERRGAFLPIREASCRYRAPVRYDDKILVHTGISEWRRASMIFIYEVFDATRTVLHATGMTEHACVQADGKPIRIPEWLKALFDIPPN